MAISTEVQYATIHDLFLDPFNPRLGRHLPSQVLSREELLLKMRTWTLDELALSYLENGGFWTNEALLVVEEELYGENRLVVVEGNRRLAALILLNEAFQGNPISPTWAEMVREVEPSPDLFDRVPYIMVDSRNDIQTFLGFRHVTGIKQWDADVKAGFIANLIDEQGLSYREVGRMIGNRSSTVRQHYIAYRVLLQMEAEVSGFDPADAHRKFAILYMSVQTEGARRYLSIDISANPAEAQYPIPQDRIEHLNNFATWLFGSENIERLVTDTRQVSKFGEILNDEEATEYLENSAFPDFRVAYRIAGGDEAEIIKYVTEAANNIELALTQAHLYNESEELRNVVLRLGKSAFRLLTVFPDILEEIVRA